MMNAREAAARNFEVQLIRTRNLYNELYLNPVPQGKVVVKGSLPMCKPEARKGFTRPPLYTKARQRARAKVSLPIATPHHNTMREYLRGE